MEKHGTCLVNLQHTVNLVIPPPTPPRYMNMYVYLPSTLKAITACMKDFQSMGSLCVRLRFWFVCVQKDEQERLMVTQRQQLWESIVGLSAIVEDHVDKHSKQMETLQQDSQNQAITQAGITQVR